MSDILTAEERKLTEAARGWCFLDRDRLVAIIDRLLAEVARLTVEAGKREEYIDHMRLVAAEARAAGYHEALDEVGEEWVDSCAYHTISTNDMEDWRARYPREGT